jgi:hypothetical protein
VNVKNTVAKAFLQLAQFFRTVYKSDAEEFDGTIIIKVAW